VIDNRCGCLVGIDSVRANGRAAIEHGRNLALKRGAIRNACRENIFLIVITLFDSN
jgi:hypothetical protein